MMVSLKAAQIRNMEAPLTKLAQYQFPIGIAFKLKKTHAAIAKESQFIEEQRIDLIKKHGENDGQQIKVLPVKFPYFQQDFNELLMLDIEVDIFPVEIKLSSLTNAKVAENLQLSINELYFLEPILNIIDDIEIEAPVAAPAPSENVQKLSDIVKEKAEPVQEEVEPTQEDVPAQDTTEQSAAEAEATGEVTGA